MIITLALWLDRGASPTTIIAGFATLSAIVGTYVFGAAWDDKGRK